jgi:Xaa-Pro aminopeptidase
MTSADARQAALRFHSDFSTEELIARRQKIASAMGNGVAVLAAATEIPGFDFVRQTNDFYYLTGVETPHAYLTLDATTAKSILYLAPLDEKHEKTDGPSLCDCDGDFIRSRAGIDEVRSISRLTTDLLSLQVTWTIESPAENARQCQDTLRHFHKRIADDPLDARPSREAHLKSRLAGLAPTAEFRDLSPIIHRQRLIKSPAEIEVMRRAARLTALACTEAMKATRPGIFEFQLAAVADYFFQINGAQGAGYRPIIATGPNIWMMHYWRNNSRVKSGDLVIFDYAPDFNYYTSDIGRMFPVSGKYSALQRELYGFVLEHHKALLSLIRPGRTKDEVLLEAAEKLRPVVEQRQWSKPIYKSAALALLQSKRPLSHGVGMPVHEAISWDTGRMQPGLVFAVDPELVVPEEKIYIRVEDTVVVTDNGIENLTAEAPTEMNDVERIMNQAGIIATFPSIMTNPGR